MSTANPAERICYKCGAQIDPVGRIGRRDTCLACGRDLHCCRNCSFHDPRYHNECTENQAERQVDKEAGNFCDYFSFRWKAASADVAASEDPRARLEALFRKK